MDNDLAKTSGLFSFERERDVLSYIDFITPKVSSMCGMPQYNDATMDELLVGFLQWRDHSHQISNKLIQRVSEDGIKTNVYNGP